MPDSLPVFTADYRLYLLFPHFGKHFKYCIKETSGIIKYVVIQVNRIFLVEGFVRTIPVALEEAAAIDGSSFSYTLWHIIFPICKPILTTVAIIQIFGCWNEFSFALVLIKDVSLQTVPLALTQFKGQFASDYPKQMAAMLITMAPVVILYFAFSREIIKGMVAGAVKG